MKKVNIIILSIIVCNSLKMGTWLPVGSKTSLPNKSKLKIANSNYVVWKNPKTNKWSLLRDICPHRLAPLSQGRVDSKTGCIECPYHGWQFTENGTCSNIPQSKKNISSYDFKKQVCIYGFNKEQLEKPTSFDDKEGFLWKMTDDGFQ